MQQQESTASLLLRNLIFTVLQPGLIAGLIPYYIIRGKIDPERAWTLYTYFGIGVLAVGLIIMLRCILQFAFEGKGTLSPVDPTRCLVVRGLYRYSRNPMYVGVMMILIGEAIAAQSVSLWIYSAVIFIGFNLFIMLHEEPRLIKDFGEEYMLYRKSVRRWI
jgi:protein-S-isoprenylcysteine O-methyltransferase Ste14